MLLDRAGAGSDVGHPEVVVGGSQAAQDGQRPLDRLRSGAAASGGRHDVDVPTLQDSFPPCRKSTMPIGFRRNRAPRGRRRRAGARCRRMWRRRRRRRRDDSAGGVRGPGGQRCPRRLRCPRRVRRSGGHDRRQRRRRQHSARRRHGHHDGGRRRRRAGHAAPRLLPERHPRPGHHRRRRRAVPGRPRLERDARPVDVQLRHRGHRGPVLGRHRRLVHRAQPGHQRLRQVRRRRPAHRRRHHVGWRLPDRPRGHRRPVPARRPQAGHAVSSATPRTSPCGRGSRTRASRPTPAAAATSRSCRRRTPTR